MIIPVLDWVSKEGTLDGLKSTVLGKFAKISSAPEPTIKTIIAMRRIRLRSGVTLSRADLSITLNHASALNHPRYPSVYCEKYKFKLLIWT
jgi:hypothetical protein